MPQATVSSKGWIVIPADMRKKYDLTPGQKVQVVDYGGVISLVPTTDDPIESARGSAAGRSSLTDALIRDRKSERRRRK